MWTTVIRAFTVALLLLAGLPRPGGAGELNGTAADLTGARLAGARISVLTPHRVMVASATTDADGDFSIAALPDGEYLIVAEYPALAEGRSVVTLSASAGPAVHLVLGVAAADAVTVTASPGRVMESRFVTQPVNVILADAVLARAKTVIAQVVDGEVGAHLQRTSPGMAGIVVRGLTGNKVNVFVDGVRYSNGAQRGGVNTFLDLIDPAAIDGVEVLRGTSSAQYGSDALGGSVQFLTRNGGLGPSGRRALTGSLMVGAETAHAGGVGSATARYAGRGFSLLGTIAARRTGDYRPGGGVDSHAAVTRFLGVRSDRLYPDRMPDTGFRQDNGHIRADSVINPNTSLVASYIVTRQDDANRWDQILGGDGNLISELNDLSLHLFYARLERLRAGWFDHASATYSLNVQREERVNQGGNGNPAATIGHEPERTGVHGVQLNASKRLQDRHTVLVGADAYFESLTSPAFNVDPTTGAVSLGRPRVPDGATFRQNGAFAQTTYDIAPDRLSVMGAVRAGFTSYAAHAALAPIVNGRPLWPDDALSTASVTYRLGAVATPAPAWAVTAAVATGYRAPHMTDLGTLGLTGSGFELAAPDLSGWNAVVGTTADRGAVSTGDRVEQVAPEKAFNIDIGVRYSARRLKTDVNAYVNRISGNIQKVAVILPPGAVGTTVGGEAITSQTPAGAVFVAASTVPVLVRANFDAARLWGVEWRGTIDATDHLSAGWAYTYSRARDLATGLPPNIEGGTPAPGGTVWARFAPRAASWWLQPYFSFASEQSHLSSLDLGDRRTGAGRSRANIQSFFRNGARARGWTDPGADGAFGTADDLLIVTGETLAQIQDRVLGPGVDNAPLFTAIPGYAVFGVRAGWRFGPHKVLIDLENLGDENYRGVSWGMDAPGRGVTVRYVVDL
jgi:outer membrane receptor protein involved in Fe transport